MKLSEFQISVLTYFSREHLLAQYQTLDGILCFSNLDRFWFLKIRLDMMVKAGLLRKITAKSRQADDAYGITEEGFNIIEIWKMCQQLS